MIPTSPPIILDYTRRLECVKVGTGQHTSKAIQCSPSHRELGESGRVSTMSTVYRQGPELGPVSTTSAGSARCKQWLPINVSWSSLKSCLERRPRTAVHKAHSSYTVLPMSLVHQILKRPVSQLFEYIRLIKILREWSTTLLRSTLVEDRSAIVIHMHPH